MREELIRSKLSIISDMSSSVMDHIPDNAENFSELGIVRDGIYKRLEYSLENVFDICAILNSDLKLGIPEDDESIVINLVKNNILEDKWMDKLRAMKAFRNVLVHRYGRIDDKLSYKIMMEHMDDFADFIETIEAFLDRSSTVTEDA